MESNLFFFTGSCPQQTPYRCNSFSRSYPMMPASTHAVKFLRSTQRTWFILLISTDTIILVSSFSGKSACVTFVPPPYGMSTTLCATAAFTSASA